MADEEGDPFPPLQPLSPSLLIVPPSGGDELEEDQVMSEVHLGCPPHHSGSHISLFTISMPPRDVELAEREIELDEDGDLVLTRCSSKFPVEQSMDTFVMKIQHNITSSIPSVGLQVWRAELALADFMLHKMYVSHEFDGTVVVELGAGTGLVGLLLAQVAKTVFLTDRGVEVLNNCAKNVHLNSEMFNRKTAVYVRELDWTDLWTPRVVENPPSQDRYTWILSEVEELQRASLLVAADVIYSDVLTDALFSTLKMLMKQSPEKVLYLALEKRYNFSFDDLDVVANGYLRFRSYLSDEEECCGDLNEYGSLPCFRGKRIDLSQIPQYLHNYDRGTDVEIWQIKYDTGNINF